MRGGGKAGGGEGWGGDKSRALLKLGRCAAGLKITPGQQTMSGQNNRYSQTSRNGHLYKTDTSLLRTVRLVPEMPKISYIAYLYNTDTSVKRTLVIGSVPLVSVLIRIDCIRIIHVHFYCFPFITTITSTFLLFSLQHHISIVFPPPPPPLPPHFDCFSSQPPPPPHFYCFPYTMTTIQSNLFNTDTKGIEPSVHLTEVSVL